MHNVETSITTHPSLPENARNRKNADGQYQRLWVRDGTQVVELRRVDLTTYTHSPTAQGPIEDHLSNYDSIDSVPTEEAIQDQ